MMAEIEERDTGDIGRAREWTARAVHAARDPAWTADGLVSDRWLPVSPATGRLDAFQWKVPVAELNAPGPVIEQTWHAPVVAAAPARLQPQPAEPAPADADKPAPEAAAPRAAVEAVTLPVVMPRQRPRAEPPAAGTVIPLVHSPDDPGPEAELVEEPAPEPPSARGMATVFSVDPVQRHRRGQASLEGCREAIASHAVRHAVGHRLAIASSASGLAMTGDVQLFGP